MREYWLLDPEAEVVEQYVLEGERYGLRVKSGSGEIRSEAIAGLVLPVRALFDDAANLEAIRQMEKELVKLKGTVRETKREIEKPPYWAVFWPAGIADHAFDPAGRHDVGDEGAVAVVLRKLVATVEEQSVRRVMAGEADDGQVEAAAGVVQRPRPTRR